MNIQQNAPFSSFDFLYCEEEKWVEFEGEGEQESDATLNKNSPVPKNPFFFPLEPDLFWDDEELESLFRKEKECRPESDNSVETSCPISLARKESVEWILRVNGYYGFSATTAILAVNYFDRFLWTSNLRTDNKPWMMQLAAVTCLSIAAKVEETHVPLLLDLQEEFSEYLFDAKTIQKMELLVLSSLKWRMNPVTPLSFLDHIVRRLGLKRYIHWEFLKLCENLLLSIISDSRFLRYLPSVLATATMLNVVHQVGQFNAIGYEKQLLKVLKINKEEVDECYELIQETLRGSGLNGKNMTQKRKFCQISGSPCGALDQFLFPSIPSEHSSFPAASCISSATNHPIFKKSRVQERRMKLNRVFVDAVGSPH